MKTERQDIQKSLSRDLSRAVKEAESMDDTVLYYEEDSEYNPDIFSEDDEVISKLKYIITYKLTETERHQFRQYVHNSNFHEMARRWECTYSIARYRILQIKDKILYYFNQNSSPRQNKH